MCFPSVFSELSGSIPVGRARTWPRAPAYLPLFVVAYQSQVDLRDRLLRLIDVLASVDRGVSDRHDEPGARLHGHGEQELPHRPRVE
jgi:hypothetical protein